MVHLLDVNVLVALGWPSHVHHGAATAWFLLHASEGWATCPMTECGFVRIACNPKILGAKVSLSEAIDSMKKIASHPQHIFWPDALNFPTAISASHNLIMGYRQITDAYLIGLAFHHGGRLATLDSGVSALLPAGQRDAVVVIPR